MDRSPKRSPRSPAPPPSPKSPPAITHIYENGVVGHHHHHHHKVTKSPLPPEEKKVNNDSNMLKAAADLIQLLDTSYAEMSHGAADAAKESETARKNSRAASEIARRYQHRSYPKVKSSFGARPPTPSPKPTPSRQNFDSKEEPAGAEPDPLQNISGIASSLQTPQQDGSHNHFTTSPSRTTTTRRRAFQSPSSEDRIAGHHAEEVLNLSMEVERAKQAHKSEQRMHEDTKASLATERAKNKRLEEENQKLLKELEALKIKSQQDASEMTEELEKSKLRLQAAEEDAHMALDLAKESADKRHEMEDLLHQARDEIKALRHHSKSSNGGMVETPKRSVRFAEDMTPEQPPPPPPLPETPRSGSSTPRSMVAAGRQLLRRSMSPHVDGGEIINLELTPAKSAERRRRLRERLLEMDEPTSHLPTPTNLALVPPPPPPPPPPLPHSEDCMAAAKLLQESGQRLELGGHWWRKQTQSPPNNQNKHAHFPMETMTKQYCQSVETKIGRQLKDIQELESLCGYLERKLVTGTETTFSS